MPHSDRDAITRLLENAGSGDEGASNALLEAVYDQLRRVAEVRMRSEREGHTLQPTALVHEAYLKLVGREREVPWVSRGHFYLAAAEAMRQILLDHARARGRIKRGGGAQPLRLDFRAVGDLADSGETDEIVALDEAIRRLSDQDPRAGQVVRLRFLAGLSIEETARALALSPRTVKRDWEFARAWLFQALSHQVDGET